MALLSVITDCHEDALCNDVSFIGNSPKSLCNNKYNNFIKNTNYFCKYSGIRTHTFRHQNI